MGYSTSPKTLAKLVEHLEPIAHGQDVRWNVPNGFAQTAAECAYKIREAFYIARLHPSQFPHLASASATYIVSVESTTTVLAKRIEPQRELIEIPATQRDPSHTRRDGSAIRRLDQAFGIPDIVQFYLDCQPTNDKIFIAEAPLSDGELSELATWAAKLTPPWMLLRPKGTTSLTLAPNDSRVPVEARIQPTPVPPLGISP